MLGTKLFDLFVEDDKVNVLIKVCLILSKQRVLKNWSRGLQTKKQSKYVTTLKDFCIK